MTKKTKPTSIYYTPIILIEFINLLLIKTSNGDLNSTKTENVTNNASTHLKNLSELYPYNKPDESEVPQSDEKYPEIVGVYGDFIPFLIGSFVTAGVFLLIIIGLAFFLMPTGWFCDNFLRRPGQGSYRIRKRESKQLWKADKSRDKLEAKLRKEKMKQKKMKLKEIQKKEQASERELAKEYKEQWAEKKRRDRQRDILQKEKEKARQQHFKSIVQEQKEAEWEFKRKLLEKEKMEKKAFSRIEKKLRVKEEIFKEPEEKTYYVQIEDEKEKKDKKDKK